MHQDTYEIAVYLVLTSGGLLKTQWRQLSWDEQ